MSCHYYQTKMNEKEIALMEQQSLCDALKGQIEQTSQRLAFAKEALALSEQGERALQVVNQ